ncbi:hypothetical protein [Ferrimonas lipolytica]|uniref:Uncharacterized protein n=1 Tax=Ferrimonas lipolytica TaxID=2724191 RepID=A0A6H1UG39_9GAMM|nr:hypothetical protein [Ferrimonas lipolytica]QIZ76762.1 hypothetical protein HER31_07675 [Ferrimonas lipolytica]
MNKTTLLSIGTIAVGLGFAIWAMSTTSEREDSTTTTTAAQSAEMVQIAQCSAYYDISSGTIKRMGVARMASVADRLAASSVALKERLTAQSSAAITTKLVTDANHNLMAMLDSPDQLGPLMQKFKQPCQELLIQGS